ncbi:hypothetical protein RDABS01_024456 [Bienertia sinuspersici]
MITLMIPPEKTICLDRALNDPYLINASPLTHDMEMEIHSWLPPAQANLEFIMTLKLPQGVDQALTHLYHAFHAQFPHYVDFMINPPPTFTQLPPLTCMVWNVQGSGSREFIAALKELVRIHKPMVVTLVKTHIIGFSGHVRVDAHGFSGGIWTYWKPELVTVSLIDHSSQYITHLITRQGDEPWFYTAIYASPDPSKRVELWKELSDFAKNNNKPWMLAGDFNETRFGWERSSSCPETTRRSALFNHWVESNHLLELESYGPSHTWARGLSLDTRRSARLDRALVNTNWGFNYTQARVKHLPAIQSDHCPLLISSNGFAPLNSLNRPFRFQAAWLTHEKFQDLMKESWDSNAPLIPHLKDFSNKLQDWNKEVFHNIFRQKRVLLARINGIQKSLCERRNSSLMKLENVLRRELDEVLKQEELFWYQKSRVTWLKDGDRNTTFFQLSTIVRRWRNKIVALKDVDNNWIHDSTEVKNLVVKYFADLFEDDGSHIEYDIPTGICTEFSNEDWTKLTRPYTRSDIDYIVKNMGSLKAPGPDGFQALFYQKNWDIVAPYVYSLVLSVLEGKGLPPHLNETFIVLLPKVEKPELPSQFRPIGLCNVVYKIITKALVNRIKLVLPLITANTQASFVPGRQIIDNIVIVQEVIHTMRRKQGSKGFMAIKIDFEKAYDRLKWDFIRDTLHEMNFPLLMVNVIMECVTSPSMQVLWNGEPSTSFKPSRGIRQGDPLSPYLFVLCMERLNQVIEESIIGGHWKPITASRGGPLLSNLFFADDLMLFAEASTEKANIIWDCLKRFCNASGQKVSNAKSRVYFSNNVSSNIKQEICDTLNMEHTEDLSLYLGMPTLSSRVTRDTFKHLCEKVDRRLAGWKSKYLSLAGRITLAKSTISSLANYSMQTAKIPHTICDDLDKRTKRFVWGGDEDTRKIHLISWNSLQKPRDQGGLGLRSARQANSAFLTKLGWRMLTEPTALWSRVLRHKYCKGRCDIDMFQPTSNMSNVWRGITDNASWISKGSAPIPDNLDGATVEEMWLQGLGWKWDDFSHLLPPVALKHIMAHKLIEDQEVGDLVYWKGSKNGKFSIKYALTLIRQEQNLQSNSQWDIIWKIPTQQRVRVFLWLSMHNKVLCNANRLKRNLTDDPRCKRCGNQEETLLHLLRDCPHSKIIWDSVGGSALYPSFYQGDLSNWLFKNIKADSLIYAEKWPSCFATCHWWIWRWRNNISFDRNMEIPLDVGTFIRTQADAAWNSLHNISDESSSAHTRHPTTQFIRWMAPYCDWMVLNSDGASKGTPGPAGGGAILRDWRGGFKQALTANYGICTTYKAELMAVSLGLDMARSLGVRKLEIQMDNKACIQILNNKEYQGGECYHIINHCRALLEADVWEVRLIHCYREGNKVADKLANIGVTQLDNLLFHVNPPSEIIPLLREDIVGVTTPRLVN